MFFNLLGMIFIIINFIYMAGAQLTIKYTIEDSGLPIPMKNLMIDHLDEFSVVFILNILFILIFLLKRK